MATRRGNPNLAEIGRNTRFTKENAKQFSDKGVEARRRNADIRRTLNHALNMKIKKGRLDDIDKLKDFESLDDTKNYRAGDMLALQLFADALNGDRTALDYVVKIAGILSEQANTAPTVRIEISPELQELSE